MTVKLHRHRHALGSRGERGSRVLVQRGGDALFRALSTGVSHVRCVHCTHTPARKHTTHQVRDSPEGGEGCVWVWVVGDGTAAVLGRSHYRHHRATRMGREGMRPTDQTPAMCKEVPHNRVSNRAVCRKRSTPQTHQPHTGAPTHGGTHPRHHQIPAPKTRSTEACQTQQPLTTKWGSHMQQRAMLTHHTFNSTWPTFGQCGP